MKQARHPSILRFSFSVIYHHMATRWKGFTRLTLEVHLLYCISCSGLSCPSSKSYQIIYQVFDGSDRQHHDQWNQCCVPGKSGNVWDNLRKENISGFIDHLAWSAIEYPSAAFCLKSPWQALLCSSIQCPRFKLHSSTETQIRLRNLGIWP